MRFDLQIIASWIEPGSRVLDLGCGSGDLLYFLRRAKKVTGTGIEKQEDKAAQGIKKGLSILQGDINEEVEDYQDRAFDYVILSQTLQQVYDPKRLLKSLLRIGKRVIVSFPNFGHWSIRLQILLSGRTPVTKQLPYQWYDTPNIRILTIRDFRKFAAEMGVTIVKEVAINTHHHKEQGHIVHRFPNLRATYGIIMISNGKKK